MQRHNKTIKILKGNTGASLIFVLGIMLLLMAAGVSLLTAASANTGFALRQGEHNQMTILDNSIHKNIMYSLQHDPESAALLSRQLVMTVYNANDPNSPAIYTPEELADGIPLAIGIEDNAYSENANISVTLSFPAQNVIIKPPKPAVYVTVYDDEGNPAGRTRIKDREPKTATVNMTMTVTAVINVSGKSLVSRATYEYTGGMLSDDPNPANLQHADVETGQEFDMAFLSNGYGEWRMIKHEKIDS